MDKGQVLEDQPTGEPDKHRGSSHTGDVEHWHIQLEKCYVAWCERTGRVYREAPPPPELLGRL